MNGRIIAGLVEGKQNETDCIVDHSGTKDGLFDQSFVREALADSTDAAIIMAIVTLAQNLRLKVIAEGVETEEQLRLLRLLRCDEIQGYLFSRPLPADALKQLALETPRLARGFVPALQFGTEHLGLRT